VLAPLLGELAASARAPLQDISRRTYARANRFRGWCAQAGACISTTKRKNVKASKLTNDRTLLIV